MAQDYGCSFTSNGNGASKSSSADFTFKIPYIVKINDESSRSSSSVALSDSIIRFNDSENITSEEISWQSDGNDTTDNEIILCVYWKRGKLGAAYYTTDETEVYLLNDVVDIHPEFNNLRCLLNQIQYSQVIVSSSLADSFITRLSQLVNENEFDGRETNKRSSSNGEDGSSNKLYLIPGKNKDFNYDTFRRYILGHRFLFEPKCSNEEERLLFINTYIDFKKESMVMSLGMLLKFLENYIPQMNLSHDALLISMLHQINLENLVCMDEASYKALQIFNVLQHPSAFKKSNKGSNREGLSVFGIFNRCKSKIGAKRMRQFFTNPTKDLEELNSRLDAVEFCNKPEHEHTVKKLTASIKKVDSVTSILTSIYRSRTNINHWMSLYSSLYHAICIGHMCKAYSAHSHLFFKIGKSITKNIYKVAHYINHIIDFEEGLNHNKFTVKVGIDKRLDKLRRTYVQVPKILAKVAGLELKHLPRYIKQCSVLYITELGYLLSVPIWKGNGTNIMDYQLPNFDVKFIINNQVHYKTPRCTELDRVLGDLLADICNIESKIMIVLMEFIHERVPDIVRMINLIADLDCIIAMAAVASENNYIRPVLTNERKLVIKSGRHPLQELCVDNFVPNNAAFTAENGTIKILTGPNASGKSIYLKQIAVIAFLSHIGSFVPANSACIGILDYIHSRIQTVESISTRMSSFVLDLKQMSHAMYNSTPSSLVIIDEFGKGTTEIDGLSLLAASLLHFIQRKEHCPFVLVSTHFHKLPKLLSESPMIELQYMDYMVENDEIVYLHTIKHGTCGSSLSHLAAKRAGLAVNSVKRFLEILSQAGKPLMCNTNLERTKIMLREVNDMTQLLDHYRMAPTNVTNIDK